MKRAHHSPSTKRQRVVWTSRVGDLISVAIAMTFLGSFSLII
jgi:hypothetical protein